MAPALNIASLDAFHWSDTPMWVFDLTQRRMVWANPAGVNFWSAESLEEFLARDFSDLSEASLTRNKALMAEHEAGRTVREQWTLYPRGKPRTVSAHSTGVQLADGSTAILYEALAVPDTLEPSVLRGVEALQHTSVLVALFRLDGSVLMYNPSAARTLITEGPPARGDDFSAMFVDADTAELVRREVMEGLSFSAETPLATRSGPRWHSLDARPVRDPVTGDPLILINARDISELKATQADLGRAKDEAVAANRAKSLFLATMSHEIRTPMNGMLGMAQLLLESNVTDAERQDYARTIVSSGQILLTLLNDILDLSKVEAGKLELESTVIEPAHIIHETRMLFADAARAKALRLEPGWFGPAGQCYLGDPHRLRQMLSNLVSNAVKFTANGQVRIEVREVERDGLFALLEFAVSDTGIGIPTEQQSSLFRPFSQVDSSTTRIYGGTGLGLSIVGSLAKLMGGEVGFDSQTGHGSRFWFRIRAAIVSADRRQEAPAPVKPPPSARPGGRILVVEDNRVNRKLIEALLAKIGLSVTLVTDGQQGVDAIVGGDRPDLILMDIQMPVLDGYAATLRIRQWEEESGQPRLPIIAMTANAFEEDRQHCLSVGMDDFLAKPFSFDALKSLFGKWLPAAPEPLPTPQAASRTVKTLDRQHLVALVEDIAPLLASNRFDAFARYKALEALAQGTALAPEIDAIGRLLAEFRYDLVLERLRAVVQFEKDMT